MMESDAMWLLLLLAGAGAAEFGVFFAAGYLIGTRFGGVL
jgi:hypothetical protein